MRLRDTLTMGTTPARVEILGISIPLPFLAAPDEASIFPAEEDPAALARLGAIMSDHVESCPKCRRDLLVCQAIGCDPDHRPLLAAQAP